MNMELYERVRTMARALAGSDKALAEMLEIKQNTFSGYLKPERQDNLWPLLPRMLGLFPRLSRNWLYFGEGPMTIGLGVPLDEPVPASLEVDADQAQRQDGRPAGNAAGAGGGLGRDQGQAGGNGDGTAGSLPNESEAHHEAAVRRRDGKRLRAECRRRSGKRARLIPFRLTHEGGGSPDPAGKNSPDWRLPAGAFTVAFSKVPL